MNAIKIQKRLDEINLLLLDRLNIDTDERVNLVAEREDLQIKLDLLEEAEAFSMRKALALDYNTGLPKESIWQRLKWKLFGETKIIGWFIAIVSIIYIFFFGAAVWMLIQLYHMLNTLK